MSSMDILEFTLASLALYGKPMLMRMTNGWYASLEVLVSGVGVQFKVTSDTDHPTPREAAQCCKNRLEEALRGLNSPGPSQPTAPPLGCETTGMGLDKPALYVQRRGPTAPDAIPGGM